MRAMKNDKFDDEEIYFDEDEHGAESDKKHESEYTWETLDLTIDYAAKAEKEVDSMDL